MKTQFDRATMETFGHLCARDGRSVKDMRTAAMKANATPEDLRRAFAAYRKKLEEMKTLEAILENP